MRKCRSQFFEFEYLDIANNIYQANRTTFQREKIDSFINSNPPLLSNDKILFNQYVELVRSRFIRVTNVAYADSLKQQASRLITELKKEYNLNND